MACCVHQQIVFINLSATTMHAISDHYPAAQSGFTLIEIIIVVAVIGILATIATVNYQVQVRKTHLMKVYQELSQFRLPYQVLIDEAGVSTEFSLNGLNMPAQTQYCKFSVIAPNANADTPNAVRCQIQNLSYLSSQTLSLDRAADGNWSCQASTGIATAYLPQACQ